MPRIIDSVLVNDDRSDKSTELDERMSVAAIAREPRSLDCQHAADAALAYSSQQAFEAGPANAAARAPQIVVDNLHRCPTELSGAIGQRVLSPLAFLIVHELIGRRLTDVDICAACKMLRRDFGHRRAPRLRALPRSRTVGLRSASPAPPFLRSPARQGARPRRTGFVGDVGIVAPSLSFSVSESDRRKLKSASTSARRDRKVSTENCGSSHSLQFAATSSVIHAGIHAIEPSGCGIAITSTPRKTNRLIMGTVSPHRG